MAQSQGGQAVKALLIIVGVVFTLSGSLILDLTDMRFTGGFSILLGLEILLAGALHGTKL